MDPVDVVVIGAGVVGLAIARALALSGREVVVLEQQDTIGAGISSRNSEVIHAGIYYRTGSRKALWCVRGKERMYRFCADRAVPHSRCGKLIVAQDDAQTAHLRALDEQARANGVRDLELMGAAELRRREPRVRGIAALWSPSSGIVDSHPLMLALQADVESNGGSVLCANRVRSGWAGDDDVVLEVDGCDEEFHANLVVNSAGLDAQAVSAGIEGIPRDGIPALRLAKGSYFVLNRASPFRHLLYPLPEPGGLGIHATLDLAGRVRFGPDVQWIDAPDYEVREADAERFYRAVRHYWPDLEDGALAPGYAGIRPKIGGPGTAESDFLLTGPPQHAGAPIIALYGIESPGLTASLAIGEEVVRMSRLIH